MWSIVGTVTSSLLQCLQHCIDLVNVTLKYAPLCYLKLSAFPKFMSGLPVPSRPLSIPKIYPFNPATATGDLPEISSLKKLKSKDVRYGIVQKKSIIAEEEVRRDVSDSFFPDELILNSY